MRLACPQLNRGGMVQASVYIQLNIIVRNVESGVDRGNCLSYSNGVHCKSTNMRRCGRKLIVITIGYTVNPKICEEGEGNRLS
jgi:hypothetical protein